MKEGSKLHFMLNLYTDYTLYTRFKQSEWCFRGSSRPPFHPRLNGNSRCQRVRCDLAYGMSGAALDMPMKFPHSHVFFVILLGQTKGSMVASLGASLVLTLVHHAPDLL
jgi:hypothetical protein